jgi:hypothetical protein
VSLNLESFFSRQRWTLRSALIKSSTTIPNKQQDPWLIPYILEKTWRHWNRSRTWRSIFHETKDQTQKLWCPRWRYSGLTWPITTYDTNVRDISDAARIAEKQKSVFPLANKAYLLALTAPCSDSSWGWKNIWQAKTC